MDKRTLTKIIDAFKVASTDETRYHLCAVKIKALDDTRVKITATDGTMLSDYIAVDPELALNILKTESDTVFALRDMLPVLKIIAKEKFIPDALQESGPYKRVEIGFPGGVIATLKTAKELDFSYPDTDQLWANTETDSETVQVSFNPDLLKAVFESLKSEKKQFGVKLTIKKATTGFNPIVVSVGANNGLVMPMKI